MAIYAAQKGQLWIPYGEGIYMLQYYVAPFSITNTSYGSGSYGYGSYGSTVASGTTPAWGVSTPSISLVKINDEIYFSTGSLTELRSSHLNTPHVGYFYYSSNILYIFPPDQSNFLSEEKILYPDMQNSPSWQYTTTYVKDAGEWKKSTVYVKVSGTWVKVS